MAESLNVGHDGRADITILAGGGCGGLTMGAGRGGGGAAGLLPRLRAAAKVQPPLEQSAVQ